MKLSFVILGYKEPHHVRLCIKNILALGLSFPYEVIYVDNHGEVGIPEMVAELYPEVKIILNDKNLGHPAGNNTGLRAAKGEYILMVNPDIVFRSAEEIERVLQYLDTHTDIAILGPKLHNPDGTVQYTCFQKYSFLTPVYRRTFLGKLPWGKRDINRHLMVDFDHNETRDVEWLMGSCYGIRRTAMEKVGVMDERLFLYFGDYEWCDRFHEQGWRIVYFHETKNIFHYHQRESASSKFTVPQLFSYVTRIHIHDWMTYLKLSKEKRYAKSS